MTTEKTYGIVCNLLRGYCEGTGYKDADEMIRNPMAFAEAKWIADDNIIDAAKLLVELRGKMDKAVTGAGRVNACKRIIKDCIRDDLKGMFVDNEGKHCICNNWIGLRFADGGLKSVQTLEKNPFLRFADYVRNTREKDSTDEILRAPSVGEIKAWAAERGITRRSKSLKSYTPEGWPKWLGVNPFYLMDVLEAMPGCKFYLPRRAWTPVYFCDDNGNEGVLCPVCNAELKKALEEEKRRTAGAA